MATVELSYNLCMYRLSVIQVLQATDTAGDVLNTNVKKNLPLVMDQCDSSLRVWVIAGAVRILLDSILFRLLLFSIMYVLMPLYIAYHYIIWFSTLPLCRVKVSM